MSVLPPVPYRHPMLQGDSRVITSPWAQFLEALRVRVGGGEATPLDTVADAVGEMVQDQSFFTPAMPPGMPLTLHTGVSESMSAHATIGMLQRQMETLETTWALDGRAAKIEAQLGNYAPFHDLWTATATGFTTSVTGQAYYYRQGQLALVYLPDLTGTSNSTSFTVTGLPLRVQPTRAQWLTVRITDNSANGSGLLHLTGGSPVIELYPNQNAGNFNPGGVKTLWATTIMYLLL